MPFAFHATPSSPVVSVYKHYYVSSAGSDGNTGITTGSPFQTLSKVSTLALGPGDTVSFKGGETISGAYSRTDTNTFTSGSYKIVFNSYGTGKAIIRPTNNTIDKTFELKFNNQIKYEFKSLVFQGYYNSETGADSLNQHGLYINSLTNWNLSSTAADMYVVIDSCEFTGYETNALTLNNSSFLRRGYFRVTNNNFHDIGLYGFQGNGINKSDFKISDNSFTNIHGKANNNNTPLTGDVDYAMGFRVIWSRDFTVDYNYVNNIGKYSSGGAGLYLTASKNVKFRYNEIRNVYAPTNIEGIGIYADCDCDSVIAEYNYIQNCYMGMTIATGHYYLCGVPTTDGLSNDSAGSHNNIARYNIILSDSTSQGAFFTYQTSNDTLNYAKNNFIYNNLIYLKSGYKNLDTAAGRNITAGIYQRGYQESLYVYNNIFILDSAHAFSTPTSANSSFGRSKNYIVKNNIYYNVNNDSSMMNSYYNGYWTNTTAFHWFNVKFNSLLKWADSTGFEKSGNTYTYINADPKIKNILARLYGTTAKIGPHSLDTLGNFKALMYSAGYQRGVNYNSKIKLFADTATVDFYGAAIKYPAPDVGINSIPTPTGTGGDTTNYYVDDAVGNDFYSGNSTAFPFKTLSRLNALTLDPGDSIFLKGGQTFHGNLNYSLTYEDTGHALTFTNYGTGKPTILLGPADAFGIDIYFTKHIKLNIRNIKVQGVYNSTTESGGYSGGQTGISVRNWAVTPHIDSNRISQITIANCEVLNIKTGGIVVTPGDYGKTFTCKIDSNLVYDCGMTGISMNFNWHSRSRIFNNTIRDIRGVNAQTYSTAINISLCKDIAIERNLIYNIGQRTSWSGLGINMGASKNIRARYNEIYNIMTNSHTDAEAIDLENGSDSCLVEYNYIHSTPGMGILISSNSSKLSINSNYKMYATLRGSIDSGSADYNIVRYNLMKNLSLTDTAGFMGIKMASGGDTSATAYGKNNQMYNNTIIYPKRIKNGAYGIVVNFRNDSTKIFNNIIIGDSLVGMLIDTASNKTNAYINNNLYWDRTSGWATFYRSPPFTSYTNIDAWSTFTGWETSKLKYNPLLADPYSVIGDTLNNPWGIENLYTKYRPTQGSIVTGLGSNITNYIVGAPTLDISGVNAKTGGSYGIGAFNDTTTFNYTFQQETKRLLGRDTNLVSQADKYILDSLIAGLKTDTLWTKMDAMYLLARGTQYASRLNLIKDTANATQTGTWNFTAYEGYKNNGTSGLYGNLNTQFFPLTMGINYTLNSAGFGVYSRTDTFSIQGEQYDIICSGGSEYSALRLRYFLTPNYLLSPWANDHAFPSAVVSAAQTLGLWSVNRVSAGGVGSVKAYNNGNLFTSVNSTSSAIPTGSFFIGGYGTGSTNTSIRQLSFAFIGSALTATQNANLHNRFEEYMNSYGKGVGNPTAPTTYYIDSLAGNDNNVGTTTATAWRTLAKVQAYTFKYGDTIKFKAPYTYTGYLYKKDTTGSNQLGNIVFDAYGSGKPTILADSNQSAFYFISRKDNPFRITIRNLKLSSYYNTTTETGGHWSTAINVSAPDSMLVDSTGYLKVANCEITKFGLSGISWSINDVRRNYKVNIDSNLVYDCGAGGISGSAVWKPSTIIGNTVYNIDGHFNWLAGGASRDTSAFVLPIFITYSKNFTISRNLVYNAGAKAKYGTANIAASGCRNINISYNETYGAKTGTVDGDGIDLDWGSDSCVIEYNYTHNNGAAGVLISGADTNWRSYDTIYYGEGSYLKGATMSDYNIVRYNIFKNNNRSTAYGDVSFYSEDSRTTMKGNKIYNNTFIGAKKSGITDASMIRFIGPGGTDSTRIFNNIFMGDSVLFLKSDVNNSLHTGMIIKNNMYWDSLNTYKNVYWNSSVISLTSWFTTYGYESSGVTALQYNPFLKNPWAVRDTINNAYKIDTLSAYKKVYGPSVITDLGINFDSVYAYTLTNYVLGTKDFYGSNLKLNNKYDLGAYEDTASYVWQDTTKYWTGAITRHFNTDTLVFYDSLILRLQQDSIMRDTRLLYMFYAPDTALAYRSLKLEDTLATKSGGLTFSPYGGITNDSSIANSCLKLNLAPNSTDGIYTATNSSFGVLITTNNAQGVNRYDIGSWNSVPLQSYWIIAARTLSNNYFSTIHNSVNFSANVVNQDSSSKGFFLSNKSTTGDTVSMFKNGLFLNKIVNTSSDTISLPRTLIMIGAISFVGGSTTSLNSETNNNYASFWSGRSLSRIRQAKLNEHLNWFMTRIGKTIATEPYRDATTAAIKSGSANYVWFPYTGVTNFNNDTLKLYYSDGSNLDPQGRARRTVARSLDGITFTNKDTLDIGTYPTQLGDETIIKLNGSSTNYRMLDHYWTGNDAHTRVFKSSDGGWSWSKTDTATILVGSSNITGEDIGGIIYNSDSSKYNVYIRPKAPVDRSTNAGGSWEEWGPVRKISLLKTTDFSTFSSSYKPQLPVDTNQYYRSTSKDYHKAFYNMSVIKTATNEWWGFVNILKLDDSTHDVYDKTFENATDNTVEVQLVFSKDGENWVRCNDSLAIIPLHYGKKQIYGIPTIVGNEVWIYTIESPKRHVLVDATAGYWEIWRYRISIGDLRKYKKQY